MLAAGDYKEETKRFHIYVQWLAHQQVEAVSKIACERGVQLYLDLPLGVHSDGYDVWRWQQLFIHECSVGAAPDAVFTSGQNWAFPPLHPEKLRQQSYSYYIDYLRHHLRHADILRMDHVMALHRLFWIPKGVDARHGLYVRYPAEELYAILTLEFHRNKEVIVGEDLGTVPPQVRPAMTRHGLHRMYVVQYELMSDSQSTLHSVPIDVVASLNTHDMPPFAAFWQGLDIEDRFKLGLLNRKDARMQRKNRQVLKEALLASLKRKGWLRNASLDSQAVLRACLAFLSASPARVVLVNLEDLWQEIQPQNMPGTKEECPNWRCKARYAFEYFSQMPLVVNTLHEIDRIRRQGRMNNNAKESQKDSMYF
jgi:4-alpha-glucanotransferase